MTAKASASSRSTQRIGLMVNATRTAAISDAAAQNDAINAAISGDLIAASPELATEINGIKTRLQTLETA